MSAGRLPAALLCVAVATAPARADPPALKPVAGPLAAEGAFAFATKPKKTRRAVSGIACAVPPTCLLVFDEGREARYATLGGDAYEALPAPVPLKPGTPEIELDAEAVATDFRPDTGGWFYVAGSHAPSRGGPDDDTPPDMILKAKGVSCEKRPDSRLLLRLKIDPANGRAVGAPVYADMTPTIEAQTRLAGSLNLCIAAGEGFDIEGLAVAGGRLYFGLRGPKPSEKKAFVFSAAIDGLFGGAAPAPRLDEVEVGKGRAIRDMQATEGGFLILAGPSDDPVDDGKDWRFILWNGSDADARATLDLKGLKLTSEDCKNEAFKPEALFVADPKADPLRVAVLSDGLCDGGPIWFDVPR